MVVEQALVKRRRPSAVIGFCSLAVLTIGYAWYVRERANELALNYKLEFSLPAGWKPRPTTPGMVFVYENNESHLSMRGAVNDIVSDVNPTPEMNTEALIQHYQNITEKNLPGWHYTVLEPVQAHGVQFQLIRRWTSDRCVVSAMAVRGNTTFIIALVGIKDNQPKIDKGMPAFRDYLAALSVVPKIYVE